MRNNLRNVLTSVILMGSSICTANAALVNGSILDIEYGNAYNASIEPSSGSWFSMGLNPGQPTYTPIGGFNGLELSSVQLASSLPLVENIDYVWTFSGPLAVHQTTSPTNVISASGDTATVDFSGWSVAWHIHPSINLGSGPSNGVAQVTCDADSGCGNGAGYILDYIAVVPKGDPSGFGDVIYTLHLEGTISAVPVPAAIWLFGSGLICLVGFTKRKKNI